MDANASCHDDIESFMENQVNAVKSGPITSHVEWILNDVKQNNRKRNKDGKILRLSLNKAQKLLLKRELRSNMDWDKKKCQEIAKMLNLEYTKVYKWYWCQKHY